MPFLDHMLDQLARHGMVDLTVRAQGDLHIDAHHTVEDIGITLGQAFRAAIGDKKGIVRYGHAYVPLDEALSRVVIDLSGRPGLEFHVPFTPRDDRHVRRRPHARILPGFRRSRAAACCAWTTCAAATRPPGGNGVQGVLRALRMAVALDPRAAGVLPSTKGAL